MKKLLATLLFSATAGAAALLAQGNSVEVVGKVFGCNPGDSIRIYEFEGLQMVQVAAAAKSGPDSNYHIKLPATSPKFYWFGLTDQLGRFFLIGKEPVVTIWAGCQNIDKARTVGSGINANLEKTTKRLESQKEESAALLQKLRGCGTDDQCKNSTLAELKKADDRKRKFLDSLRKADPVMHRLAALNTYFNADATAKTKYQQERDFFAKEYFKQADFSDAGYNDHPAVYDAFKQYANALTTFGFTDAEARNAIEGELARFPQGSKAYKNALAGVVIGLSTSPKLNLCDQYLTDYTSKFNPPMTPSIMRLRYTINQARTSLIGAEAPDFTMNSTEDKPLSLKQLRGSVLLVDFWASWCGPCRRENPAVVAAYTKYKDRGFNILGVSLDSQKERWLDAIKADNLTWPHVSDLRGWQNEAAKLYSVTSIPQNVLLDKEGKILARNLRGEQLEQKLAEVFAN